MPFMKGPAPIRRTLKYLEAGRLCLKDQLKILTVNYNTHGQSHQGARWESRHFILFICTHLAFKNVCKMTEWNSKKRSASKSSSLPDKMHPKLSHFWFSSFENGVDLDNCYREFVFWHLPHVQYKNPQVQIATFKNLTPSPFIRAFYGMWQLICAQNMLIALYLQILEITCWLILMAGVKRKSTSIWFG